MKYFLFCILLLPVIIAAFPYNKSIRQAVWLAIKYPSCRWQNLCYRTLDYIHSHVG